MFNRIDRAYYERCARDELGKAQNCLDPGDRRAHLAKAEEYRPKAAAIDGETVNLEVELS